MTRFPSRHPFPPTSLLAAWLAAWLAAASLVRADEPMSESADSLDFEKFHSSTDQGKPLIGAMKADSRAEGVNVFDRELDNPSGKGRVQTDDLGTPGGAVSGGGSRFNRHPGPPPAAGEIMNIRVRYTLTKSEHTPFLAHTATHALHSYIVDHCPQGWVKLAEWSLPVEEDHFLYYQFRCAER